VKLLKRKNLAADERGAIIIELAVIAPVLALMTVGMVDMSSAFSRKLALEQGAHRAIEKIMQTTGDTTVGLALANEAVCQVNGANAAGVCNTSPITLANVTVTYRLECKTTAGVVTTVTKTDAAQFDALTCANNGVDKEARYVQVAITDKYTPMMKIKFAALDADGTYHVSATAGTRIQ
jgi:Flp pilus assembly protein TadG